MAISILILKMKEINLKEVKQMGQVKHLYQDQTLNLIRDFITPRAVQLGIQNLGVNWIITENIRWKFTQKN